jgi:hypothetical protein
MELQSIDIKTAFLYSPVKEEIYIQRPPGINDDIMPPFMKLKNVFMDSSRRLMNGKHMSINHL